MLIVIFKSRAMVRDTSFLLFLSVFDDVSPMGVS